MLLCEATLILGILEYHCSVAQHGYDKIRMPAMHKSVTKPEDTYEDQNQLVFAIMLLHSVVG